MYPMKQNPFSSGSPFLDSIKKRTEKMENRIKLGTLHFPFVPFTPKQIQTTSKVHPCYEQGGQKMQNLNLRDLISFKKHSFKNRYGKYFSLGPILHLLDKCFAPMLPFKTPYCGFISITLSTSNCSTSDYRALRFAQPS